MVFHSIKFLIFLSMTVLIFFCLPLKFRWLVLLLSSVIFYCIADVAFLPFLMLSLLTAYGSARLISRIYSVQDERISQIEDKSEKKRIKEQYKRYARIVMFMGVAIILFMLSYSKFTGILLKAINALTGMEVNFDIDQVIVPLGISYYSFSLIGYILDIYWRRYESEKRFFHFCLFGFYFPQILQGPIARYNRLMPQFDAIPQFDYKRVTFGLQLMLWGYFKKLVIADRLNLFVSNVFEQWNEQTGLILMIATVFYSIQLYADFSGCVDIASGISQVFGITLDKNFNHPYFATSVEDFWHRWHISLGSWFRDYVYMPVTTSKFVKKLTKNVRKKVGDTPAKFISLLIPIYVTWCLTGIWHGTGWNYVLWGLYHGTLILAGIMLAPFFQKINSALKINTATFSWKLFQMIRTFFLCGFISRMITRPGNLTAAKGVFWNSFFLELKPWILWDGTLYGYGLDARNFILALLCILLLLIVSILQERGSVREMIAGQNLIFRWGIYYAAFFSVIILGVYGYGFDSSKFVYMTY